eukprot:5576453-Pleurochrysis_carterae.AAC.1
MALHVQSPSPPLTRVIDTHAVAWQLLPNFRSSTHTRQYAFSWKPEGVVTRFVSFELTKRTNGIAGEVARAACAHSLVGRA